MIKKAVKTVFKFLFKPILNRYHLILEKLDKLDKNNHILHERLDNFEHEINDVLNNLIGNDLKFLLDCNFLPEIVEYQTTSENIYKLLTHIETVWNNYGCGETYFSVLTNDMFLKQNLSKDNIEKFYATGEQTMLYIKNTLRRCGKWDMLIRKNCMEYGCGVGRVTIQLSKIFENVTALDISQGHIELAQQRVNTLGIKNISFKRINSLNFLTSLPKFDFIFSVIVLQHNPPPIIAMIIEYLFQLLTKDGILMFQVPTQIKGYSFIIDNFLAEMSNIHNMEMHMLPQNAIFEIARRNNCYPIEVHNDNWTGEHNIYISQTFVFQKID